MLTLLSGAMSAPINVDDYHVRQLSTGENELEFNISIYDPMYQQIQEESQIKEQSDALNPANYLVKAIDGGASTATVICKLNLDDWRASMTIGYNSGSLTVAALITAVLPSGWKVVDNSGVTIRRTIELEAATPYDVLTAARDVYGITFSFDNINKLITVINPENGRLTGAFATKELNLKENNYKGKSSSLCTRLYAYGKDNMNFAEINGGKPYVENNKYSNKIICGYWKDERYTVPQNLLYDAKAKLEILAMPERSYDCSVMDLAKLAPAEYGFLDFQMFDTVGLIDESRAGTVIYHRIVEYWVYPYYPEKNKVVLSTSPAKIQSQLRNLTNAVQNPNSEWNLSQMATQSTAIDNAVTFATDQITGVNGGYVALSLDDDGHPYEILIMDTPDKATAQKVWRWNQNGLGYSANGYNGKYGLAMTQDGAIVADFITVGAMKSDKVTVGGFTLSATALKNGMRSFSDYLDGVYLGTDGIALGGGNFSVDAQGNLHAQSGDFAGYNISARGIFSGMSSFTDTENDGVYIGLDGIALGGGKFKVDRLGNLTAQSGLFEGNVYAGNIQYGGDAGTFDGYGLTGGTVLGGWGGAIGGGTITTANTGNGINGSLARADSAYDTINNYGYIYVAQAICQALRVNGTLAQWITFVDQQGQVHRVLGQY